METNQGPRPPARVAHLRVPAGTNEGLASSLDDARGARLTLVVNHANDEVSRSVLASVRRALRREGLLEPATNGRRAR